jgi:hypothetical protein
MCIVRIPKNRREAVDRITLDGINIAGSQMIQTASFPIRNLELRANSPDHQEGQPLRSRLWGAKEQINQLPSLKRSERVWRDQLGG